MRITLILLLALLASVAGGAEFRTIDPLKAFVRGDYPWGDDYFIHGAEDTTLFRCVLTKEKDGVDGVALSEVSIWGNHGGPWEVFEKTKHGFVYAGPRSLPDTACLESCQTKEYLASGRCLWKRGVGCCLLPDGRSTARPPLFRTPRLWKLNIAFYGWVRSSCPRVSR